MQVVGNSTAVLNTTLQTREPASLPQLLTSACKWGVMHGSPGPEPRMSVSHCLHAVHPLTLQPVHTPITTPTMLCPLLHPSQLESHCCFPQDFRVAVRALLLAHQRLATVGSAWRQVTSTTPPCTPLQWPNASPSASSAFASAAASFTTAQGPLSPTAQLTHPTGMDRLLADVADAPSGPDTQLQQSTPLSPCAIVHAAGSTSGCASGGDGQRISPDAFVSSGADQGSPATLQIPQSPATRGRLALIRWGCAEQHLIVMVLGATDSSDALVHPVLHAPLQPHFFSSHQHITLAVAVVSRAACLHSRASSAQGAHGRPARQQPAPLSQALMTGRVCCSPPLRLLCSWSAPRRMRTDRAPTWGACHSTW